MTRAARIALAVAASVNVACLDYVTNFNCRTSADCEDNGLCIQGKCVPRAGQQVSITVVPATVTLTKFTGTQFAAVVTGVNEPRVTWSVQENPGGMVNSSGGYMTPGFSGTFHVVATSVADVGRSASAVVTVPPVDVAITNPSGPVSVEAGTTYQLAAQVTGAINTAVTWSVQEGASGGTVDASGLYTAPSGAAAVGTWHVVATSVDDPTRSATAAITVTPPPACTVTVSPPAATVPGLGTQQFAATVTGPANKSVIWSVQEGASGGSVSTAGLYTAPVVGGAYHVVAACAVEPSQSAVATVTVPPVVVSIAQQPAGPVLQGGTFAFGATVAGAQDTAVTWSVVEAGGGSISPTGAYTAPKGAAAANTWHVKATSVADPGRSATAAVVVPAVTVSVTPGTATVVAGASKSFTAGVGGAVDTGVTWSVLEAGGGSVTNAAAYTAPIAAGTYHVVATSTVDETKAGSAAVTVPPVIVTITPATTQQSPQTVLQGASFQFSAAVTAANAAVTWSVVEAGGGSVAADGTYTAPSGASAAGTWHVKATSGFDPARSDIATIVVPSVAVAVTPQSPTVAEGDTKLFTAAVSGAQITAVIWAVQEGAAGGSISSGGLYTAPTAAGTYHVVATSTVDGTKSGSTAVTVPPVLVTISPATQSPPQTVLQGGTLKLSASASGAKITTVNWSVLEGASGGSVASDGTYTAPAGTSAPGTYHVVATSAVDPSRSDSVAVQVPAVSVAVTPSTASMPKTVVEGGSFQFTANVSGAANTAVSWQVQETGGGTVASDGTYLAPSGESAPGTYHVVATSLVDPTRSDTATVVVPAVNVSLPQGAQSVLQGGTFQFNASVTGASNTGVTWAVVEVGGGSVSASGKYTAPTGATAPGVYTVKATSVVDTGKSASVAVTVPAVAVSVVPTAPSVTAGFSQTFTATVTGAADTSAIWSVQEAGGGAVTSGGVYTAPGAGGTFHVVAISKADVSKSAMASVTVPAVSVAIDQGPQNVLQGGSFKFSATVTNAKDTSVTWSVQEAGGGSTAADGTYTAPSGSSAPGTYHLVATSKSDPAQTASVAVTVPAVTISISPTSATVLVDGTVPFTATVTGAANSSVTWTALDTAGGSITVGGLYTAPSAGGIYHVAAASVADPTKTTSVQVLVTQSYGPPSVPAFIYVITPSNGTAAINIPVTDPNNLLPVSSAIASVTLDLTAVGGNSALPITNYTVQSAQTALYTYNLSTTGLTTGAYVLPVTATDSVGATATGNVGVLVYEGTIRDVGGGQTFSTIQSAINATSPGDLVLIHDGTYTGAGNTNLTLGGRKIVVASQNGPQSATIDCQGSGRGFNFAGSGETNATTIAGLTIRNAAASAVRLVATNTDPITAPTFLWCTFKSNTASAGAGALYVDGANAKPQVINDIFDSNTAASGASASAVWAGDQASVSLQSCQVTNNGSATSAIPVASFSTPTTIAGSTWSGNQVGGSGGTGATAMIKGYSNVTVSGSVFSGNDAKNQIVLNSDATLTVASSSFVSNTGYNILWSGTALLLSRSVLSSNTSKYAQTIYSGGQVTVDNTTFAGNVGQGEMHSGGSALITDTTMTASSPSAGGNAVYCTGPSCVLDRVSVDGYGSGCGQSSGSLVLGLGNGNTVVSVTNTNVVNSMGYAVLAFGSSGSFSRLRVSKSKGGLAVWSGGPWAVADSSMDGNGVNSPCSPILGGYNGAAMSVINTSILNSVGAGFSGPTTIKGSVFVNNIGSALQVWTGSTPTITSVADTIFEGNTAGSVASATGGNGGAVWFSGVGPSTTLSIRNSTIINNSASQGSAVWVSDGTLSLKDSIIWNASSTPSALYVDQSNGANTVVNIDNSDIQSVYDPGLLTNGGTGFIPLIRGNLSADPLFVTGPKGDAYLSQTAAGQSVNSPCVDTGSASAASLNENTGTTRTDGVTDTGTVDMGYHYPP